MSMRALTSFADTIRAELRSVHRDIDHHPLLAPLVRDGLTLQTYGDAIAALHAPLMELETRVGLLAAEGQKSLYQSRHPLLEHDLARLGRFPIPLQSPPLPVLTRQELLGVLYVLAGSCLGGAVIARQLKKSLPPGAPIRFFGAGDGEAQWRGYWQYLQSQDFDEDVLALIISGAKAGFSLYLGHLNHCNIQPGN